MGMDHRFQSPSSTCVVRLLIGATILSLFASGTARAQQRDTTTQVLRVTREQAIHQALSRAFARFGW